MEKATKTTPKGGSTGRKRQSAEAEHAEAAGQVQVEVETREVETVEKHKE